MSTYDEYQDALPDQHAVSAHLTTHHARNGSIISNHQQSSQARRPSTNHNNEKSACRDRKASTQSIST
jgi:hypothetical protein